MELCHGARVHVRIHDVPLPATVEPDGVGNLEMLDELLRVGNLRIVSMKHPDISHSEPGPRLHDLPFVVRAHRAVVVPVAPRCWNDDEPAVSAACKQDEVFEDEGPGERAAASDDQVALRGTVFGRLRLRAHAVHQHEPDHGDRPDGMQIDAPPDVSRGSPAVCRPSPSLRSIVWLRAQRSRPHARAHWLAYSIRYGFARAPSPEPRALAFAKILADVRFVLSER